ncbi:MAG: hypothetical protein ACYTE8_04010 [Planctomycetota bacterium]|jgi:hypothetical protein
MLLRLLTLVVILTLCLCVTALSGCKGKDEGGTVVENWKKVMGEICDVLNSIDDKESAEEAIPKLKELAIEFTHAKNDLLKNEKDNPGFELKYFQEHNRALLDWGKALSSFNTNQNVPEDLRKQIMKILSL